MNRAETLRDIARLYEDVGMCLCAVGPVDWDWEPCPNHRRAAELYRKADEIEATDGRFSR